MKIESIMNMNETTGKYAKWILRVVDTQIVNYKFTARNEQVDAQRFMALMVSDDATQYFYGTVPFAFKDRDAAKNAATKYGLNTVWELKRLAFDHRAKVEYNGAPFKKTVLLQGPSALRAVPPTENREYQMPVNYVAPKLSLADILQIKDVKMQGASLAVDFAAKIISITPPRSVIVRGEGTTVMDVVVADGSVLSSGKKSKVTVNVWGKARHLLSPADVGRGAIFICASATRTDEGDIKVIRKIFRFCGITNLSLINCRFNSVLTELPSWKVLVFRCKNSRLSDITNLSRIWFHFSSVPRSHNSVA